MSLKLSALLNPAPPSNPPSPPPSTASEGHNVAPPGLQPKAETQSSFTPPNSARSNETREQLHTQSISPPVQGQKSQLTLHSVENTTPHSSSSLHLPPPTPKAELTSQPSSNIPKTSQERRLAQPTNMASNPEAHAGGAASTEAHETTTTSSDLTALSDSPVMTTLPVQLKQEDIEPATPTHSASGMLAPTASSARSTPSRGTPSSNVGNGASKGSAKKPAAKKGTATKKGAAKNGKKAVPMVTESLRSSRSATPANRPKSTKKQAGKKVNGSHNGDTLNDNDEEGEEGAELYCICRRPDNHKWMIACDGCDEWFHGECVGLKEADQDLIDKVYCPNCCDEDDNLVTTWLRMCRFEGCRNPARLVKGQESKYCSDEHGSDFFRKQLRPSGSAIKRKRSDFDDSSYDDSDSSPSELDVKGVKDHEMEGLKDFLQPGLTESRPMPRYKRRMLGKRRMPGGAISRRQVAALVASANNSSRADKAIAFKSLGDPLGDTESLASDDLNKISLNKDDQALVDDLKSELATIKELAEMLQAKEKFIGLVKERLKVIERKEGLKGICGYDNRLSWEDDSFEEWRMSAKGQKIMAEGDLDTELTEEEMEAAAAAAATSASGGENNNHGESSNLVSQGVKASVCRKKRCTTHINWRTISVQEVKHELAKCQEEEARIVALDRDIRIKAASESKEPHDATNNEGWVETLATESSEDDDEGYGTVAATTEADAAQDKGEVAGVESHDQHDDPMIED